MPQTRKLNYIVIAAILAATGYTHAAVKVDWSGMGAANSWLYNASGEYCGTGGAGYSGNNNWVVQLMADVGNNNNFNTVRDNYLSGAWNFSTYSDSDALVGTANFDGDSAGGFSLAGGSAIDVGNTYANTDLYVLWFNNSSKASATQIGIIYGANSAWRTPAPDLPNATVNIFSGDANIKGTDSAGNWYSSASADDANKWHSFVPVPVPEPGTMGLFALGLLTIAARRRASRASRG